MKKVIITTDSSCDLLPSYIKDNNIDIIPFTVLINDESYFDGININSAIIYDYVDKNKTLPMTAAPSITDFTDFFNKHAENGETVIHISISAEFSSSYQHAVIAAEDIGSNVYVIDSRNLSTGVGHIVRQAVNMVQDGISADIIVDALKNLVEKVDASFIIDRLDYMVKGGRCSAVAALGANLLKIKPCIEVKNGKMTVCKKYRGNLSDVLKKYIDERLILQDGEYDKSLAFVTHTGYSFSNDIVEYVKNKKIFDNVIETNAGATITSHCGPNTLGVLFIRK